MFVSEGAFVVGLSHTGVKRSIAAEGSQNCSRNCWERVVLGRQKSAYMYLVWGSLAEEILTFHDKHF